MGRTDLSFLSLGVILNLYVAMFALHLTEPEALALIAGGGCVRQNEKTDHRGEVLICTDRQALGVGWLYKVGRAIKGAYGKGRYGYYIKDCQRIVEMPVKNERDVECDIVFYPKYLYYDL